MQELNDNPKVVSENFEEMYAKLFGRKPIEEKKETDEEKEKRASAIDIIKNNISVYHRYGEIITILSDSIGMPVLKNYG